MPFNQCKSSMSAVEMKSSSVNEHDDVTLLYRNTLLFPRATKNPQLHCKSAKHLCKFLAANLLPCIGPEKLAAHQFVFGPSVFLAKLSEQCRCAGRMEICLCVLMRGVEEKRLGAGVSLSTFVTCLLRFLRFLASCSFLAIHTSLMGIFPHTSRFVHLERALDPAGSCWLRTQRATCLFVLSCTANGWSCCVVVLCTARVLVSHQNVLHEARHVCRGLS